MMQVLEGNIPNHYKTCTSKNAIVTKKRPWYTQTVLNLKRCWNLLAEGPTFYETMQSFKGNAGNRATLSLRNITFFEKYDLGL